VKQKTSPIPIILAIILVAALCCLCIALVLLASGTVLIAHPEAIPPNIFVVIEQPLPNIVPPSTNVTPTEELLPSPVPSYVDLVDTLSILNDAIIPINDPIELAERLAGKNNIPRTITDPNAPYQIGDRKAFWVTNVDNHQNFRVHATVRYVGENSYFWIEDKVAYEAADLITLGNTFDQEIFPTTREFFGPDWTPGVDNDPRIHILYAGGLGKSLAGYYSSADQLHPDAHEYSNAHEMFLINADNVLLWQSSIYSTLAHELQHMILWHIDRNEVTWLNEGFSMLAEFINGYHPGGFDRIYIQNTDIQLTSWGANIGQNGPHYGAAMLFTMYFYDRFGEEVTQALVAEQKSGMESIDMVLAELDIRDPLTDKTISAEDVFADWAVTNFLGESNILDGRFHYSIYPNAPTAAPSSTITSCPTGPISRDIAQYGVDYIKITCSGDSTLTFEGLTTTPLLPVSPYSGQHYVWSNMGDHANMTLQRRFDLTEVSRPVKMTYKTWYDLEENYDYVFVSASIDEQNWEILNTTSCTTQNPSGNSYGCGLNGRSTGWILETVDLSLFAGEEVTVRFDYVTDAAVNGEGMVIDDIRIDAIDYFTDFEADDGGWYGEGFVRINNTLPQLFRVTMITFGDQTNVIPLVLDDNNAAMVDISIGGDIESIVLVISGTTPYTRQRALYQVEMD